MKNKMRKIITVVMMACVLFTVCAVNSNDGIMPCGELVSGVVEEIN